MIQANDRGVWLTNAANANVISGNSIYANTSESVWIERSHRNTIVDNEITASSGDGVTLEGATENTVRANTILENGGGVRIAATTTGTIGIPSTGNTVEGNTILDSGGPGIFIDHSDENLILDNVSRGANGDGIELAYAEDNLVRGNDVRSNKSGLSLMNSSGNRLEDNDASGSQGTGITLEALSVDNDLIGNTSSNNDGDGIYVGDETSGENGILLEGNVTHNNKGYGIYVSKVSHTLIDNIANDNGGWGIWVSDGSNGRVNTDGGQNRAQGNHGPIDPFTFLPLQCFAVECDGGPPADADLVAPDTLILEGPVSPTTDPLGRFIFNGTDNAAIASYQCLLDDGAWTPCASPADFDLAPGIHRLEVRAVDTAGNIDLTPASYEWRIDAAPPGVAPAVTMTSSPDGTTVATSATFAFSSNERNVTFECRLDGASLASCNSPTTYGGLSVGAHTFEVRATRHSRATWASKRSTGRWPARPSRLR